MKVENLKDLYVSQIEDIYYAEKQITKALPKMAKKATNQKLADGFLKHLEETKGQIERLEQVFASLSMKPKAEKCEAITGIIKEAEEMMSESKTSEVLDAAMIFAAQKVEHYEMATYGTLAEYARTLGFKDQEKLLRATLKEETACNDTLTQLAEGNVNDMAKAA